MIHFWWQLPTVAVIFGVFFSIFVRTPYDLTEPETCPECFGLTYCNELKNNVSFKYDRFIRVVFNLVSVKNVYFAANGNQDLVIKKLIDKNVELNLPPKNLAAKDLVEVLTTKFRNFETCDLHTAELFLNNFSTKNAINIWTLVDANVEPLLLELFPENLGWPVPKLYGYCGRTVVVENCGIPLIDIENFQWHERAYVALQLLEASEQFTLNHPSFRLYLTDISPDNIVVNPVTLEVCFVDLENAVLQKKKNSSTLHVSDCSSEDDYAFSTDLICESSLSDHNLYSICLLLLSSTPPWPMMRGGLLHSPPPFVKAKLLFKQIDQCVCPENHISRFSAVDSLKKLILMELDKK